MEYVYVVRTYAPECKSAFVNAAAFKSFAGAWELAKRVDAENAADLIDALPILAAGDVAEDA